MKRYAVFRGDRYYPFGGWEDLVDSYDSLDEAKKHGADEWAWAHIVDLEEGCIIMESMDGGWVAPRA